MRAKRDLIDPSMLVIEVPVEYILNASATYNVLTWSVLNHEMVSVQDPETVGRLYAEMLIREALYELGVKALESPIYTTPEIQEWVACVWDRLFKDEFAQDRTKALERDNKELRCR